MADHTKIEWTDSTWNVITGCTLVDDGCRNCYAAELAATRLKHHPSRAGLSRRNADGVAKFTGEVRFNEGWLTQPMHWRQPRMIFVCAHGDLFHPDVPDEWIDRVFAVMALCPQHIFQVLTKRPERMRDYFARDDDGFMCAEARIEHRAKQIARQEGSAIPIGKTLTGTMPWPHVWLGTSISDQASADQRIPALLNTPATVRFVSAEPLLGRAILDLIDVEIEDEYGSFHAYLDALTGITSIGDFADQRLPAEHQLDRGLDWVILGGESGRNARPMHPDWARGLRDQCVAAEVPFFFKQWGEWQPYSEYDETNGPALHDEPPIQNPDATTRNRFDAICLDSDGTEYGFGRKGQFPKAPHGAFAGSRPMSMYRIGKKAAGGLLDGREWGEVPQ